MSRYGRHPGKEFRIALLGALAGLLVLASPVRAALQSDADALYCLTVYAEAKEFAASPEPARALTGSEAQRRWLPLGQRESDLLNDDPRRHAAARAIAQRRLAALPAGAARADALQGAFEECRRLEDAPAPARRGTLSDHDALYCLSVYAEARGFADSPDETAALMGMDAETRWLPLSQRENDLLNDDPARHAAAARAAGRRFAALPALPGPARSMALAGAYDECRRQEDAGAPPDPARAQLLADRRFCRELMARATQIGPQMRSLFNPDELATLDETHRIAKALARPLPGRALSAAEDREAGRLLGERRAAFDLAVANWSGREDPMVAELGKCHEDYRVGRLGGPNVLDEAPAVAPVVPVAKPDVAAAGPRVDLGAVFRMREIVPGGNLEGIWRRRGESNIYDGLWVHATSGKVTQDMLEVRGIENGELVIARAGMNGSYRAKVNADGSLAGGRADWVKSAKYSWRALPAQSPRGMNLGAVLHMREVSRDGSYEGIWRQRRDRRHVYDALWVHVPTGALTADVLVVAGVERGRLVIQRYHARGSYFAPLWPDGRLAPGTASWATDPAWHWLVVPAQQVSVQEGEADAATARADAASADAER